MQSRKLFLSLTMAGYHKTGEKCTTQHAIPFGEIASWCAGNTYGVYYDFLLIVIYRKLSLWFLLLNQILPNLNHELKNALKWVFHISVGGLKASSGIIIFAAPPQSLPWGWYFYFGVSSYPLALEIYMKVCSRPSCNLLPVIKRNYCICGTENFHILKPWIIKIEW